MYKVGDHVLVVDDNISNETRNLIGVIQAIDEDDDFWPYSVRFEDLGGESFWCQAEWLVPALHLNLRPDIDELVDQILM